MSARMSTEELTRRLVSFDTVSIAEKGGDRVTQSTRPIADFVSEYLEAGGFKVWQLPYTTDKVEKVNLVAFKGGQEPLLALSGHMDVVPVGEWRVKSDPFELTRIGDKFYGRGAADMKLFDAIAMLAGCAVSAESLKQPFALYLTSDEEVGCLGVKQLLKRPSGRGEVQSEFKVHASRQKEVPIPKYTVIGEPTELVPMYMHKGYMFLRINIETTIKKAGHSSDPSSGKSVIKTGLPEVLSALTALEKALQGIEDGRFEVPFPTINPGVIGMIGTGAAKNVLATGCWVDMEVRPLPGQDPDDLLQAVRETVRRATHHLEGIKVHAGYRRSPTPSMETAVDSPVVQTAASLWGETPATVSYNTEGGTFNRYGAQSVIFGPASIAQAHKPDEFAHARWFEPKIVDLYAEFIRRFCC